MAFVEIGRSFRLQRIQSREPTGDVPLPDEPAEGIARWAGRVLAFDDDRFSDPAVWRAIARRLAFPAGEGSWPAGPRAVPPAPSASP